MGRIKGGTKMNRIFWAIVFIVLGLWIWLSNLGYLYFKRDWPILLVIIGIYMILTGVSHTMKRKSRKDVKKILKELEEGKINADEAARKMRG